MSYNLKKIPTPLNHPNIKHTSEHYSSIVWGQTGDSKDKVCETTLPELSIGDWLYFDNMGAYTVSVASTFNGFGNITMSQRTTGNHNY